MLSPKFIAASSPHSLATCTPAHKKTSSWAEAAEEEACTSLRTEAVWPPTQKGGPHRAFQASLPDSSQAAPRERPVW